MIFFKRKNLGNPKAKKIPQELASRVQTAEGWRRTVTKQQLKRERVWKAK